MGNNRVSTIFLGIIVLFIFLGVMKLASEIVIPFVIALLLSFIFSPLVNFMRKKGIPNGISVLFIVTIFLAFCFLVGLFLYQSTNALLQKLPEYYTRYKVLIENIAQFLADISEEYNLSITDMLMDVNWQTPVSNFMNSSGNLLSSLALVLLFLVFILLENHFFLRTFYHAFSQNLNQRLIRGYKTTISQVSRYLGLKFLFSFITGILVFIFFLIVNMDFALIWGVLAIVLNFIPTIGSLVHTVAAGMFALLQFYPDYSRIVLILLVLAGIQLFIGSFLDPRGQGNRLNLSPLIIMVSLLIWGWLWGIAGMFLAVPLLAIIKITCESVPELKPIAVIMENRGARAKELRRRKKYLRR